MHIAGDTFTYNLKQVIIKTALSAVILLALVVFGGCGTNDEVEPNSLVTKWGLVQDSTANSIGAAQATTTNYAGLPGDYFDFRADGKCYIKEGNVYDTLAYQLISSDRIAIEKFGFNSSNNPCTIPVYRPFGHNNKPGFK